MRSEVIDSILSVWAPNDKFLSYSEIKKRVVAKGLISKTNDRSLARWLRQLAEKGLIKKTESGYLLESKPKAYQVFDYLAELRQKYPQNIYEGSVGGLFSHICAPTFLNFDESLVRTSDEKIAFDIITVRLAELFQALYLLRNDLLKRRSGLSELALNEFVIREALVGFLLKSNYRKETTEFVSDYMPMLGKVEHKMFEKLWSNCKPKSDDRYINELAYGIGFDNIENNVTAYKNELLDKDIPLKIDKYPIEELIDKYIKINQKIEKKFKPKLKDGFGSYTYSEEESELIHTYRTAILVKIAETVKILGYSTEDLAVILTRDPATMNEYYTPEHTLYEAMEWASHPPDEEVLNKIWQENYKEEGGFEGMMAAWLSQYNHLNYEILKSFKSRPWVKNELAKYGDYQKILELYKERRKAHLDQDKKFLGSFSKEFSDSEIK